MGTISIEGGTVVTMDPHRRVIKEGVVTIEDGVISTVSKREGAKQTAPPDLTIDATGKVVIPGLIDTHIHLAQALIRGCADDLPLVE